MSDSSIRLVRADTTELNRVESLLAANGLPHQDVRAGVAEFFLAYIDTGDEPIDAGNTDTGDETIDTRDEHDEWACVGAGGLEVHGSDGLLRSLVVAEPYRGRGYGAALCDALEASARRTGVVTLYLLTTTAAPFFRRRGFETVERESVPERIQETAQFADLCPESATCMTKTIGE